MELACGECGMSVEDFYSATPRETIAIMKGRRALQEDQAKLSWEQARWQTWHLVNMQTKRRVLITDLGRFPWESQIKQSLAPEQYTSLAELQKMIN
jgi:hypothetical protein